MTPYLIAPALVLIGVSCLVGLLTWNPWPVVVTVGTVAFAFWAFGQLDGNGGGGQPCRRRHRCRGQRRRR